MPTKVRFGEYDWVVSQNKHGAVCPYCNILHSATDGKAVSGDCPGIYVRRRKAAFVVMGHEKGRAGVVGGQKAEATGRNFDRIASAAEKDWYDNHA